VPLQLHLNDGLQDAVVGYLLHTMIRVRKHSIMDAAVFSRSRPSRFSGPV